MLIGEPPRTQFDLRFSLFGIPVRIHPFFWVIAVLLGMNSETPVELLVWVVAVFISILVHELGHALVMRAHGFAPWITLYGLGGLASYNPAGSYGSRRSGALAHVLISAAGPGAGFLLAAVVVAGVLLTGHGVSIGLISGFLPWVSLADQVGSPVLHELLGRILFISIFWGFVNLLPVYPLDGGQIAREILLKVNPRDGIRQSLILSIAAAVTLAVIGLTQWQSLYVTIFFAYLAYMSYATLQAYLGRRP